MCSGGLDRLGRSGQAYLDHRVAESTLWEVSRALDEGCDLVLHQEFVERLLELWRHSCATAVESVLQPPV